jgi:magnesium-transporting ATPase (P-type)
MGKQAKPLEDFWDRPLQILLQQLQATPAGLTTDEAKWRLRLYGPNSMVQKLRFAGLLAFLRLFANPLVVILLVASGVSLGLGDDIDGLIIIAIVLSTTCAALSCPYYHLSQATVDGTATMTRGKRNVEGALYEKRSGFVD